ncbi:MAG: DUF6418 domain-containing protein [Betaproteobacteria bacterium]
MLTLLFALAVLWGLRGLIVHRTAAAIAATFLLFSLFTRTVSLVYVDLAGPVYAEQLDTMVGGGASMPLFAMSILLLMAALAHAFRPSVLVRVRIPERRSGQRIDVAGRVLFTITAGFVVALYGDMLRRGVVPLLSGMDRLEYNASIAGPLHGWLAEMGFLLAGTLGAAFCMLRLQGRDFDFRFLALYLMVLAYFALTGNRFSAFYSFTSFFVLPLAAVPAMAAAGLLPEPPARSLWRRFVCSKTGLLVAVGTAAVSIVGLLLHSVITVRGYDAPFEQLAQRTLIQPVELWWTTWNDLDRYGKGAFDEAWAGLFTNPIDPTRNTSIQMLMLKHLGDERAQQLLDMGQQYTGGYPEVLFELLGPWLALPAALAFSVPTAILLRVCVLAVCERRLLTAFMAMYVFFGFSLLFIGGMLNFLVVWTFWAKIAVLCAVYVVERRQHSIRTRPRSLAVPAPSMTS